MLNRAIQVAGRALSQAIQVAGGGLSRSRVTWKRAIQVAGRSLEQAIQVAGREKFRLSRSRVAKNSGYPGRGLSLVQCLRDRKRLKTVIWNLEMHHRQAIQVAGHFSKSLSRQEKKSLFCSLSFYPFFLSFKDLYPCRRLWISCLQPRRPNDGPRAGPLAKTCPKMPSSRAKSACEERAADERACCRFGT